MTRDRIAWVDIAKGIGITLVVLGHTLRGLEGSGLLDRGPGFLTADSWIYSFHMPLFFLLSGLFARRRIGLGAGEFVRGQLATIAYPYVVWSTIQTLVQVALSRHTNHPVHLSQLARILVDPIMQFWFLYVLFLIGIFYYVLRRCGLGPWGGLVAAVLAWLVGRRFDSGFWPLNAAASNGCYYALGALIGERGLIGRIDRLPTPAALAIVVLGYGLVTAGAVRPELGAWAAPGLALCGIAASIALAVLLGRVRGADFVRVLGAFSLEIYVAHTIASAGLRIGLQKLLKVENPAIHIAAGTLVGLVLPLALALLCRRSKAELLFRLPRREATVAGRAREAVVGQ